MEESRSSSPHEFAGVAVCLILLLFIQCADARGMSLEDVALRARTLAAAEYRPPGKLPRAVREIGYDQHRGIRYRSERNLWSGTAAGFELAPLAPGNVYKRVVRLNEVIGTKIRHIQFDKDNFSFDDAQLEQHIPKDLGFAGFELLHDFGAALGWQKFFVFAGASYFRGFGAGGQFGLSVRGATVDTGLPSGEEFPEFVEFWLVRPPAGANSITLYALLDGPSLAGAYEFIIAPGAPTQVDVRALLYTRKHIAMLGIAALTSMYFYGENTPRPHGAWRPEVHDSDGLVIESFDGQRLWQPLRNPAHITLQSFPAANTRRFALLQRDTQFASYQDPGTNYHRRPSASVELLDGMSDGRIVLVQLPTANEYLDNIVAFWAPPTAVAARSQLDFRYRLYLGDPVGEPHSLAHVVDTFVGRDVIAANLGADKYRFIIDFSSPQLQSLAPQALRASIDSAVGTDVLEHQLERIAITGAWRLAILARAPADKSLALRAALHLDGKQVTETWHYELEPGNVLRRAAQ
jgi:glucans biosynthesis protein